MSMIDDIKRDRENGTPGPWAFNDVGLDCHSEWFGCAVNFPNGVEFLWLEDDWETDTADARRVSRVPDMEAALLDAEELAAVADQVDRELGYDGVSGSLQVRLGQALAAYRAATEADQ